MKRPTWRNPGSFTMKRPRRLSAKSIASARRSGPKSLKPGLTEFWMVEPEVAYAKLDDIMALAENFIKLHHRRVLENRKEDLKHLERDVSKLEKIAPPFPRLQYDDAVKMLQEGYAKGEMESRFEMGRRPRIAG